jgi:hypothetical protein
LGIVFPELGTHDKHSAFTALRARITTALTAALDRDELHSLHVALHYFPEDPGDDGPEKPPTTPLYPDLAERDSTRKVSRALKRAVDVVGSVAALILLAPLLLAIAAAVKLPSLTVLFRQRRVGQHGVPFTFPVPLHACQKRSETAPRLRHAVHRWPDSIHDRRTERARRVQNHV